VYIDQSVVNQKTLNKNRQNASKYQDSKVTVSWGTLKTHLKYLTAKNSLGSASPPEKHKKKYVSKHSKNKRSEVFSIRHLCDSTETSKNASRNYGVKINTKNSKVKSGLKEVGHVRQSTTKAPYNISQISNQDVGVIVLAKKK
jgi:hypothetical protein